MGSQGASPHHVLPCLWTTAGVLAYRLCDLEYDCDHCPLDAALRGAARRADAAPMATGGFEFPADRRYHAGHGWMRWPRACSPPRPGSSSPCREPSCAREEPPAGCGKTAR
jgi:hypothetical protein